MKNEIVLQPKQKVIEVLDKGLQDAFDISFYQLTGKLKPNTSDSLYAAFIVYYLRSELKLKASTIGDLLDKSHDKIIIQYKLFSKHIESASSHKSFFHTISKDRKEIVEEKYPKFLAHLKTFALIIFAKEYEQSLKKNSKK